MAPKYFSKWKRITTLIKLGYRGYKERKFLKLMTKVSRVGDRFGANQKTLKDIIRMRGLKKSLLTPVIKSTRVSTEGGLSQVIAYKNSDGITEYVEHVVTNRFGKILHHDIECVRLDSGQIIERIEYLRVRLNRRY